MWGVSFEQDGTWQVEMFPDESLGDMLIPEWLINSIFDIREALEKENVMPIYNRFNIVTKKRQNDWVACAANNLNEYATGDTEEEAIGNLVKSLGETNIDDTQKDMGRMTVFKSQRYSGS